MKIQVWPLHYTQKRRIVRWLKLESSGYSTAMLGPILVVRTQYPSGKVRRQITGISFPLGAGVASFLRVLPCGESLPQCDPSGGYFLVALKHRATQRFLRFAYFPRLSKRRALPHIPCLAFAAACKFAIGTVDFALRFSEEQRKPAPLFTAFPRNGANLFRKQGESGQMSPVADVCCVLRRLGAGGGMRTS